LWTDHLEEKLKEIYDVRGFFLTTAQEKLKPLIDERYLRKSLLLKTKWNLDVIKWC